MPAGPVKPDHLRLGQAGENAAWNHLKARGYALLHKNWTKHRYELDLICEDRKDTDSIVFVEVKTRGAGMRGTPSDALTPSKMQKLVKGAALYLSQQQFWDRPCRFDLVSVVARGDDTFEVEHIENAFDLSQVPGAHRIWQP